MFTDLLTEIDVVAKLSVGADGSVKVPLRLVGAPPSFTRCAENILVSTRPSDSLLVGTLLHAGLYCGM
eukprot:1219541-Prymnesium_polylepis.1